MAEYSEQEAGILINWFPELRTDSNFQITSDCTPAYNCIGWALGMNDVWVGLDHPFNYSWAWWPKNVPSDESPESLVELFEYFGFTLCEGSGFESDFDKVALFADKDGWTHAARVVGDNILHSKIGTAWDIQHSAENAIKGALYGDIFAYMKRPVAKRFLTDEKRPTMGTITIAE